MVFGSLFPDIGDEFISSDSKREIIRSYLPGLIEEGFTANASLQLFQDVGLGIGRSEYLGIYREVLGIEEQTNRIRFVNKDAVPSESLLGDYTHNIDSEYRFIYKYGYTNSSTGKFEEAFMGVNRDTLDTVAEMEADAADYIRQAYGDRVGSLESITIWKGFKG